MSFIATTELYNLRLTLLSGQMFRAYPRSDGGFDVLSKNQYAKIYQHNTGDVEVICDDTYNDYWNYFLHLDQDLELLKKQLDTNPFLANIFEYSQGLVLLRQDPWETLVSFIISQQKRIPQIQNCIEGICDMNARQVEGNYCAFPSPREICSLSLSSAGLGYRMPYVYSAAYKCFNGGLDLAQLVYPKATYQEALNILCGINGIGPKVANCVALYGLQHSNAFPIDTHISKMLALPEMQGFNPRVYGNQAGLLQLYLFNYAIHNGL